MSCQGREEPESSAGEHKGGAREEASGRFTIITTRISHLFLLNVFAKNQKTNLTKAEQNEMKKLLPRLVAGYLRRKAK
jgi:hypothetical protein